MTERIESCPDGPALGVSFEGREPATDVARLARLAETAGIHTIWLANHLFQRDPIVQATAALAGTTQIRAALMAMSPYATHPVQAAMAAASLDEHFPGRATLSFGIGAPGDFNAAGIERRRPLQTMRECLAISRALLDGKTIDHQGKVYEVRGRALETGAREIPVVLAATGPKMLALAGEMADGVLLSAATSLGFVEACLARVDDAGKGRNVRKIGLVFTSLDADERAAYDRLRPVLAFVLRGAHHKPNLEASGVALDQAAVYDAAAEGDWNRAADLISDEVVAAHTASGTPEQVRDRLAAYHAAGLDEVVLAGIGGAANMAEILAAVTSSNLQA